MNSVLQKRFLSESKCFEPKSNSAFITTFIFIFEHTISLHSHDIKTQVWSENEDDDRNVQINWAKFDGDDEMLWKLMFCEMYDGPLKCRSSRYNIDIFAAIKYENCTKSKIGCP